MRWEYAVVISRMEVPEEVEQRLDALGRNGWEAIGLTRTDGDRITVLMKRRFRPQRPSEPLPQ
jgi:hypothetical protein